jgi:hypothetical protein
MAQTGIQWKWEPAMTLKALWTITFHLTLAQAITPGAAPDPQGDRELLMVAGSATMKMMQEQTR